MGYEATEQLKASKRSLNYLKQDIKSLKKIVEDDQEKVGVEDLETLSSINDILNDLILLESKLCKLTHMNVIDLDVMDLEVGTKFKVINGMWYGEIVLIDGKKYIEHDHGTLEVTEDNCKDLQIEILGDKKL